VPWARAGGQGELSAVSSTSNNKKYERSFFIVFTFNQGNLGFLIQRPTDGRWG